MQKQLNNPESSPSLDYSLVMGEIIICPTAPTLLEPQPVASALLSCTVPTHPTRTLDGHTPYCTQAVRLVPLSALEVPSWPSDTAAEACRRMRPLTGHCMLKSQWVWLFLLREASQCQMGCDQ